MHTPGPWRESYVSNGDERWVVTDNDDVQSVACVLHSRDAALIAAAPDLYEALSSGRPAASHRLSSQQTIAAG